MVWTVETARSSGPAWRTGLGAMRGRAAALAVVAGLSFAAPIPALAKGPESLANLAAQVTDAVVNISASTTVETRNRTMPQLPPGTST